MRPTEGFVGEGNLFESSMWPVPTAAAEEKCWYRDLFLTNGEEARSRSLWLLTA
jgi:hypothetical protein